MKFLIFKKNAGMRLFETTCRQPIHTPKTPPTCTKKFPLFFLNAHMTHFLKPYQDSLVFVIFESPISGMGLVGDVSLPKGYQKISN